MSIPFTWIYLVHDPYTGLYKIGKADNPKARLKQLRANAGTIPAAPAEYRIVEAWLAPIGKEGELHGHYRAKRARGEWFELDEFDILEINWKLGAYERLNSEGSYDLEASEQGLKGVTEMFEKAHQRILMLETALQKAHLMGFGEYQKLLLPAPAIDTDRPLHEIASDIDGVSNAAAIDLLQEIGEITF